MRRRLSGGLVDKEWRLSCLTPFDWDQCAWRGWRMKII
jgi:hypothetical protein